MASLSSRTLLPFDSFYTNSENPLPKTFPIVSGSSKSQFYGLKFSCYPSLSIPKYLVKTAIFAAVNKRQVPPSFTLKDQDGKSVSLSKYKGARSSQCGQFKHFVCCGEFSGANQAFAKKYRLPFTLLADEGNRVSGESQLIFLELYLGDRLIHVLDRKGVLQLIYNNQFQPEKYIDETLKLLQSLRTTR